MTFEPIWGSIIAWYLFLAGLGGGAYAGIAFLRWRYPEAKTLIAIGRFIAPVVVVVGLFLLMFDATAGLQNPLRFALLLTNFGSVMTWGVVFLGTFVVIALLGAGLCLAKRDVPKGLDAAGAVLGVCVAVYTGCLLGVCETFPLWNSAVLPVLFLVSALSTGMAAMLAIGCVCCPAEFDRVIDFKRFHLLFPLIEVVLVAALLFITANDASAAGRASVMALIAGDYALVFWTLFIAIGLVIPTALEIWLVFFASKEFEHGRPAKAISFGANIGFLVGGFVLRLLVLLAAVPVTIVTPWL